MAILTQYKAAELIRSPANKLAILEAYEHEERIKLHTKPVNKKDRASSYFGTFLTWVKDGVKLPADKYEAFKSICLFPLPTTSLCTSIRDEYKKIFTASDSYREYSLLESTFKQEFKDYIENEVKVKTYFENKGLDDLMKQHNCIYVVDLPSEQLGPRPDPYFYKVSIGAVVDISVVRSVDNMHRIGYLIFKRGDRWIVIDDNSYKVFVRREKSDEIIIDGGSEYIMLSESFHNLGYTPACFLSVNNLYDDEDGNLVAKKNTLSDAAGDLDWLLFWKVAERMYETYGPFPIMTMPENKCDYTDMQGGHCEGGIIATSTDRNPHGFYDCPVCAKHGLPGPGTVMFYTPASYKDEAQPNPQAVHITPPDIPSLEYITKKTNYLEWEIYANAVGQTDEGATKEAINEKQVQSNTEGKRNVFMDLKKNFEHAEQFIVDTIGRLRYADYYEGSTIKMGEDILLYTADDVIVQYENYKKAGLSSYLIASKKKLLIQTEFKNNSYEKQRAELMEMLEPWPNLSIREVKENQLNLAYPEKFLLKIDFAKYVSNFELSNGDIIHWGSLLSLELKIKRLTEILLKNVRQDYETRTEISSTSEGGAGK